MRSTMQDDYQLTVPAIFAHGRALYANSEVASYDGTACRRATFAEVADRATRLAGALQALGVEPGDRVGTLSWNNQEHLEAYLAIPSMGAVLHTLNLRISPEQLTWVINHAEDKVVIVDGSLTALLAAIRPGLTSVEHVIVVGGPDEALPDALDYDALLAEQAAEFEWPFVDEKSAAGMCYTSGTTGDPKGVVYSHRSTYLHSMGCCLASSFGLTEHDRVLPVVPMFHANAWGLPYGSWFAGSDLIFPGPHTQPDPLSRLIVAERPTVSGGVPTVWADLTRYLEDHPADLSSIRFIGCGGAAVPRHLMARYLEKHGVRIVQAWGMTETSPIAAIANPPRDLLGETELDWLSRTGRPIPGVEMRIVDDSNTVLPWDGQAIGEIECRGPWITGDYYRVENSGRFHDGWLRTGDVGTIEPNGFVRITDRSKDVIKSGGEWISSVDLELYLAGHPDVVEAAVIAVPDPRWDERPLACIVPRDGTRPTPEELRAFLAEKFPKWWLPEHWAYIDAVPRTSVGKFDKKVLRARHEAGGLDVLGGEGSAQ
ncbi:MAG: long-chain fatty acid--CoA ligase [Sporichthyaceae bacterium]